MSAHSRLALFCSAALLILAANASATPESDADRVMDWAESTYPSHFPSHVASRSSAPYYYRCYANGYCLGASNATMYFYDGWQIAPVGSVAGYLAKLPAAAADSGTATRPPYETQISGDDTFKSNVGKALALLKSKAPDAYDRVIRNVGVFRQAASSGMRAYDSPPVFEIGDLTSTATTTWFASTIAHDATHSMLYHDYLAAHPGERVPDDIWIGKNAEITCMAFQLTILKQIGGPAYEVDYLAKLSDGSSNYWDNYSGRFWGM